MAIPNYDALKIEPDTLVFWENNKIYAKAKAKSKKGKDFYFLDGPPYTSGKVHLGTAWNKSLKDMVLRYKRMNGFNVWDRAGYDMHGLPTSHKVQEKFNLPHKEDIEKFGVEKFIKECINLSVDNMKIMNVDFARLGVWMDFANAYQSIDPNFIEGEWWLIKKAHENGRLYEGEKVMHWCANCETTLAKHELEYKNVADDSIFLKFKVKGKKNEYLIIWTTTPWTIPYNLAVMVNPEIEYIKAKVDKEVWIVAKPLAAVFISGVAGKKFEISEEFTGDKLEGIEYEHPLHSEFKKIYDDLKKKSPKVHTVILSEEYVDTSAGTGLVHCAPGCGPEDYEVGHKYHIPPFNNLQPDGSFPKEMGKFKGYVAKKDDKKFIEEFKKNGSLIESTPVEHEYAHCWRCHKGVVFRTTKQWFFKIEDLKDEMRRLNKEIYWMPDWAGSRQFDSWLDNLRDNSITRQIHWGCPAPIWRCDKCKNYTVVGSVSELKKLAGKVPKDLHIPWIDSVKIKCDKCSAVMSRIPDVLDVWVDAGTTSWTCLDYPQKQDTFKRLWPADFILEGKDQIRGWFNLLFVDSMIAMNKPSYKAVYMHGFINDAQGRKMSKSQGNYILPEEVISKYGSDTFRYYSIGSASPGEDMNYNFEDVQIKQRNLIVLWNIHKLLLDLFNELGENPAKMDDLIEKDMFGVEEKYIFSKLHSTIAKVTKLYDDYKLNEVPLKLEELFLELSRGYIQMVREKSSTGSDEDKKVVMYTIYKVLSACITMFAPVTPFITEAIYQNLRGAFNIKPESIHLAEWPKADKKFIDLKLEENVLIAEEIIQAALSAREKIQMGLKWPLKEIIIITRDEKTIDAVEALGDIIQSQINVKGIKLEESFSQVKYHVKADFAKLGPSFGAMTPQIIAHVATHSPETILRHLDTENKYTININGKEVSLNKEHFVITRDVPYPFAEALFKNGQLYLNQEKSDELEAEGFARELMRKTQAARKNAGLEKSDSISLYIQTNADMAEALKKWEEQIKLKCGASHIKISELPAAKKHSFVSKEKIKKEEFEICFDKI